jgi:hypothetical protein
VKRLIRLMYSGISDMFTRRTLPILLIHVPINHPRNKAATRLYPSVLRLWAGVLQPSFLYPAVSANLKSSLYTSAHQHFLSACPSTWTISLVTPLYPTSSAETTWMFKAKIKGTFHCHTDSLSRVWNPTAFICPPHSHMSYLPNLVSNCFAHNTEASTFLHK